MSTLVGCLTFAESLKAAAGNSDTEFLAKAVTGSFGVIEEAWLQDAVEFAASSGSNCTESVDILLHCNFFDLSDSSLCNSGLLVAAQTGSTNFVKKVLRRGFPLFKSVYGIKTLQHACRYGDVDIVRVILAHATETVVNTVIKTRFYDDTVLITTVKTQPHPGYKDIMKLLLAAGATVNMTSDRDGFRYSALDFTSDSEEFKLLLEATQFMSKMDMSSYFWSAYYFGRVKNMKLLLQYGAEPVHRYEIVTEKSGKGIILQSDNTMFLVRINTLTIRLLHTSGACQYEDLQYLAEWLSAKRDNPEVIKVLHELALTPRSLKAECRLVIYESMTMRPHEGIKRLNLPKTLTDYMLWSDV